LNGRKDDVLNERIRFGFVVRVATILNQIYIALDPGTKYITDCTLSIGVF